MLGQQKELEHRKLQQRQHRGDPLSHRAADGIQAHPPRFVCVQKAQRGTAQADGVSALERHALPGHCAAVDPDSAPSEHVKEPPGAILRAAQHRVEAPYVLSLQLQIRAAGSAQQVFPVGHRQQLLLPQLQEGPGLRIVAVPQHGAQTADDHAQRAEDHHDAGEIQDPWAVRHAAGLLSCLINFYSIPQSPPVWQSMRIGFDRTCFLSIIRKDVPYELTM